MNDTVDIYVTIICATLVLVLMLTTIISLLLAHRNRQIRHQMEIEQVKETYQQEILKTQLEIKEQTLKTISDEIHDNIGQVLSLITLNISALDLKDKAGTTRKLADVLKLLGKVITDLRNLSKTIDGEYILRSGLVTCAKQELELIERAGRFKTTFTLTGDEKRVDRSHEIIVYRILQEALNNAIKHSCAANIAISLTYTPGYLALQVTDDGKGFDINTLPLSDNGMKGSGLHNMKNRSALINATFAINSTLHGGTQIRVQLPLNVPPL